MTELAEAYNFQTGQAIEIKLISNAVRVVNNTSHLSNTLTESLEVKLPDYIKQCEYLIATDKQGCIQRGKQHLVIQDGKKRKALEFSVPITQNDTTVFVHISATQPENKELSQFVDLVKLRKQEVSGDVVTTLKTRDI